MFQIIHDLRTPTISLKSGAEIAQNRFDTIDLYQKCLDKMKHNFQNCNNSRSKEEQQKLMDSLQKSQLSEALRDYGVKLNEFESFLDQWY